MKLLKNQTGFTLVEVIVTLAISMVIMGVIVFNYSSLNDNVAVSGAAQEIAVAIRGAQANSLNVKESLNSVDICPGGGKFCYAYGIYFNPTDSSGDYTVFVDSNNNNKYDVGSGCGSGSTECLEKFILRDGIKISSICNASACPPSTNVIAMHITFLRPNPDARVNFTDNSGNVTGPYSLGKVVLSSPRGKSASVSVDNTGQILVQ